MKSNSKKLNTLWLVIFLVSLVGSLIAVVKWLLYLRNYLKDQRETKTEESTKVPMMLPLDQVFSKTKYKKMIPLMIAQQKHESGNFTSRAFIEQNNPFGMKEAKQRNTTDVDGSIIVGADGAEYKTDGVGYSEYPTLLDAAKDFKMYLDSVNFEPTDDAEQFVLQLKSKGYFTDTVDNYLKGVKYWLKN